MRHIIFSTIIVFLFVACDEQRREQPCDPACNPDTQRCIEGICRDLTCPEPCRSGRVCVNGFCSRECEPEAVENNCGSSEVCCEGIKACIDTSDHMFNCGECGNVCPPDRSNYCNNGRCACRGYTSNAPCGEGYGCCETGCENLLEDPKNCGECGHSCEGLECVNGRCMCSNDEPCPTGEECCEDGCRNLNTSGENCGQCGRNCADEDSLPDCCNGDCVNTLTDLAHCGSCGSPCEEGQICCIGGCVDPQTDPFNCGDCFVDCGAGGSCSGGRCQ